MKWCSSEDEGHHDNEKKEQEMDVMEPLMNIGPTQIMDKINGIKAQKEARKMKALKDIQKAKKKQIQASALDDPLATFGIGIVSYRNTLFELFIMFAFLTLVSYPMKSAFAKGGAINDQVSTTYGKKSISNLGYASVQCMNVPYGMGIAVLSCPYGSMAEIVPNGVGATPFLNNPVKDACLINDNNKNCSGKLDIVEVQKEFTQNCIGKNTCTFDFVLNNKLYKESSSTRDLCFQQNTNLFIQYTCEMTDG